MLLTCWRTWSRRPKARHRATGEKIGVQMEENQPLLHLHDGRQSITFGSSSPSLSLTLEFFELENAPCVGHIELLEDVDPGQIHWVLVVARVEEADANEVAVTRDDFVAQEVDGTSDRRLDRRLAFLRPSGAPVLWIVVAQRLEEHRGLRVDQEDDRVL